jgi:predicted ATPase
LFLEKDALLDGVWGRRFVSEGAVKTVVSELCAALGDDARAPAWIETVPRRGYRFIGAVQALQAGPARSDAPMPGKLPLGLPAVIGREFEAAQLVELLAATRLVTLTGPAGVGKTQLALAVADAQRTRHADGAWLLELAPLAPETTDAATLRASLAQALQLAPGAAASDAALVAALQGLSLLLVVDNAEHLLQPLAPLLAHLQLHLPQLRLLVTSREPLQVPGEQVLRVPPLRLPEGEPDAPGFLAAGAARLFVARVAARWPHFVPADAGERQAVAQICRALDGLPLALELAAARVPVLGLRGLATQLAAGAGTQLQLLTHGARTAAPHQRTLRATLDWSHALLSAAQQRVFRRLAVFRGGCTLEAAQAVCSDAELDGWAVLDALGALTEKSMLIAPSPSSGNARFTQLESLHDYAHEQLRAAGELHSMQQRHLQATCAYWARADARALGEPAMAWLAQHLPELDNLRAALRHATQRLQEQDDDAAAVPLLALLGHSGSLWPRAGLGAEGWAWLAASRRRALQHPDARMGAGVELALASVCRFHGGLPLTEGLAAALHAAQAFQGLNDAVREYHALYLAWGMAYELGRADEAACHLARMHTLVQPGWSPLLRRFVLNANAQVQRQQGQHEAFLASSRELLLLFRGLGAQGEAWMASLLLMLAEADRGQTAAALAVGQQALDEIRQAGRLRQYTQLLAMHTALRACSGEVAAARGALAEALPLRHGQGGEFLLLALAWLALHEGRQPSAARLLGHYRATQRSAGAYGPGSLAHRLAEGLAQPLQHSLGPAEFEALCQAGGSLGDEAALQEGLGAQLPLKGVPPPRS